jgi:ankyrin repeat protein
MCHSQPSAELIDLLLEHGADPNAYRADDNCTIWEMALREQSQNADIMKTFILHGADLKALRLNRNLLLELNPDIRRVLQERKRWHRILKIFETFRSKGS